MEYLMQWCLVCERRLEVYCHTLSFIPTVYPPRLFLSFTPPFSRHQGLYCSPACLSHDFVSVAPTTLRTTHTAQSLASISPLQSAASTHQPKSGQPWTTVAASTVQAPPMRQRFFSIDNVAAHTADKVHVHPSSLLLPFQARVRLQAASLRAMSSAPSGSGGTRWGPADTVVTLQQHILAPAFSLEFQSRRERVGCLRGSGNSLKWVEGGRVLRNSSGR
ncbi:hypothetical protein BC830DRAFT_1169414 [Chytriomyces sp. MP71]|nr:hypothetical protein BC830DRAFT_1169414 [Chytriomyces sp. MP71]